jgi:hypothetical protein
MARPSQSGRLGGLAGSQLHRLRQPTIERIEILRHQRMPGKEIAANCRQVHGEGRASAIATWKAFLRNQAAGIDAMDFLVVSTAGFKLLLIPLTLPRQRRRLISQYRRSRCCTSRWPTALSKAPLH